jgi:predicted RNA-binding protein with EMAP domain
MDTLNDLRIQWLERLFSRVHKYCKSGTIKDRNKVCGQIESKIKELKYSYADENGVLEYTNWILDKLLELQNASTSSEEAKRWLGYTISELEDFPRKLRIPVSEPFQIFRYKFVEIVSVSKHPSLQNLRVTKVRDADGKEYTVITNITNVKEGEKAAVVFLPPREFGGVWSEAMFVALNVEKPEEIGIEKLKELNQYFFAV